VKGWLTVIAWEAGQASVAFLGATVIQGLIILNQPNYVPTRWQGTLLYYVVLACMVFVNTFLARWLPKVEGIFLCFHIIGFFAILIPLVYLGPHGSAKDVFATFINGGDWSSDGLSFFVGIIASVYTFTGNIQLRSPIYTLLTSPQERTAPTIVCILRIFYSFTALCFSSQNPQFSQTSQFLLNHTWHFYIH
jgi:amino acid transporter